MSTTPGNFAANQFTQLHRQFYCGATNVPETIFGTVLRLMGNKWKQIEPKKIASPLFNEQVITQDEHYQLCNDYIPPGERMNSLVITVLPRKGGDQQNLLVTFYHCLLKAGYSELAREVQQRALVQCGNDAPILAPENVCGINSAQTLEGMINKLKGKQVSPELAKEFRISLGLDDNDVSADQTDLGIISEKWILKKTASCSPEALVEALVLTPGLGRFASGIGCPNNPHEARSWFSSLQDKWWEVASYLGYTKDDVEVVESEMDKNPEAQIQKFLNIFQMPDCGARTMSILHKLGDLSGVDEVHKKPAHYTMHPGLYKIDHAAKKELVPAQGYPMGLQPMISWYPGPSEERVACGWVPHSMAAQPCMPAAHMKIAILAQAVPWDYAGSMSYVGTDVYTEFVAQQASNESYRAETEYHRQTSQQSVDGEDVVTSNTLSLEDRNKTVSTAEDLSDTAPHSQPDSLPGTTEPHSVTTSEQHDPGNELKENGSCAPLEIIRVPESNDVIQNCKDPSAVDFVKVLLNSGANLHIKSDLDGFHPIHLAVLSGNLEMIKLILSKVPETIDSVTDNHQTPVMIACRKKYIDCVELLVERGADVTAKDCNGFSCLHLRHTLECPAIVSFLVEKGGIPVDFSTDGDHLTALTLACLIGDRAYLSAEYLLSQEANPNGTEQGQITPLSAAAGSDCKKLIEILLTKGANVNIKDKDGTTPLLRACKHKQIDAAVKLIDANANLDEVDENGESCVFAAVASGCTELLQILIACGADVNLTKFYHENGGYQLTPLALASARGNLEIVEMLVGAKANVNYDGELTIPAIAFAVVGNSATVVEYFLKLNEISKTVEGLGPAIECAIKRRNRQILKILLNALGGYEKVVHRAVEEGHERFAELLREVYESDGQEKNAVSTGAASVDAAEARARDAAQLNRRQLQRSAESAFEEFVHLSVSSLERKKGRQYFIEVARSRGNYAVAQFYQKYFEDPRSFADVMREFLKGRSSPSDLIFNDPNFNGVTFKKILEENDKLELVEMTMLALLHYPGVQALPIEDGADILKVLFGERFYREVESAGLLDPAVIRPRQPSRPPQPPQQSAEPQYTKFGATPSSVTPRTGQQNLPPQQGHTGRKLGGKPREAASTRGQTLSPLDTHLKAQAHADRLQERARGASSRPNPQISTPVSSKHLSPQTRARQSSDEQVASDTGGHLGKSHRKLPRLPPSVNTGPQYQTLGHSEHQQRTSSTSVKPKPAAVRLPPSTPPVCTSARPNIPSPRDEVRATSHQRMKHQGDPNVSPLTQNRKVTTQRSWSTTSTSSLDSAASDDIDSPHGPTKPQLFRQDTGYTSNPDDIGMPANQASGGMPESLYKPLDLSRKETLELLKTLALLIPNWQMLAHQLGLQDQEIQEFETNYTMWQEQCFQMLKLWIEKGGNASCAKLVEGFRKMQRQDLEPLIHQHVESLSKPKASAESGDAMKCEWTTRVNSETVKDNVDNMLTFIKSMLQQKYKTATIRVSLEK